MIPLCVYSAALRLPHILCNSACLSCKNGFCVYLSLTRHIYCSRLEGIKSKLLNTLARLSSKDFFNPRRLSLHPLKGVYTPFSRGPFGTCPAFNQSHIGDICVPYGTRSCSRPLLRIFVAFAPHILFTPRQSSNRVLSLPSIWRYMSALRHPQLLEASAAANKFAPQRPLASVASLLISPNRGMQINLLCSRLLRIFAHLF